jgi:small subunit ribosomal protein S9
MSDNKNYKSFVGKRKEAVARLRLFVTGLPTVADMEVKKGDIVVNGKKAETYFGGIVAKATYEEPFKITNTLGKYTLSVKIVGGGTKSQLEAFIHAVSKGLSSLDEKSKHILKKKGFLTRDSRVRERRKVGMGGKARRKRQSPKR